MIIIKRTSRSKPLAEGSPTFGVSRSMKQEPMVNARLRMADLVTPIYAEFTISELRAMLAFAERTGMVKQWDGEQDAKLEAAVEREALPYSFAAPNAHRYSVEEQQDRKWAVFCGLGFVKGGFMDRAAAVNDARQRVAADKEAGVPVVAEIGGQDAQKPFHLSPNYHGNM